MSELTIEVDLINWQSHEPEALYYLVSYETWFFGFVRKKRKLVARMPYYLHDREATLKLLRQAYLDDYNYDENGKPVLTGSPPPSK